MCVCAGWWWSGQDGPGLDSTKTRHARYKQDTCVPCACALVECKVGLI